jgi:hypothetical protein
MELVMSLFRNDAARQERRRRILMAFRQHGATSPEKAMTSGQLGLPPQFDEFMGRRGEGAGVIVALPGGRYYLDEARLREIRAARGGQAVERVIIKEREVVKIRCQYCGCLYDQTANKCPSCGAPAGK